MLNFKTSLLKFARVWIDQTVDPELPGFTYEPLVSPSPSFTTSPAMRSARLLVVMKLHDAKFFGLICDY